MLRLPPTFRDPSSVTWRRLSNMRVDRLLAGVLALVNVACGTEPANLRIGCSTIEVVEVGAGTAPRISWEPSCTVASLDVYEAHPRTPSEDPVPPLPTEHPTHAAGTLMWAIASPDSLGNRLRSSVRYGEVPGVALERKAATPLQDGQPYLVRLIALDPDGFVGAIAWELFMP
jgi:hypothetical protein